jgi:hypothetical protein
LGKEKSLTACTRESSRTLGIASGREYGNSVGVLEVWPLGGSCGRR